MVKAEVERHGALRPGTRRDPDEQSMVAREGDCLGHVPRGRGPDDERGDARDHAVPDEQLLAHAAARTRCDAMCFATRSASLPAPKMSIELNECWNISPAK